MTRRIVSNIGYDVGLVFARDHDNKAVELFKKQGELDGACATYSVVMALLVLGVISERDAELGGEYTDRKRRKLFKVFCEDYGMHRNGQTFYKIKKMLDESFSSVVTTKHRCTSGRDSVNEIVSTIDEDLPVVISVSNQSFAHALLAIGYEEENGTVQKLLCMDPSGEKPRGRRWNAEIGIARKRRFFDYYVIGDDGADSVELDDILIIKRK